MMTLEVPQLKPAHDAAAHADSYSSLSEVPSSCLAKFFATRLSDAAYLPDGFAVRALDPALNGEVCRATDQVAAYDLDTFRINGIVLPIIVALRFNR